MEDISIKPVADQSENVLPQGDEQNLPAGSAWAEGYNSINRAKSPSCLVWGADRHIYYNESFARLLPDLVGSTSIADSNFAQKNEILKLIDQAFRGEPATYLFAKAGRSIHLSFCPYFDPNGGQAVMILASATPLVNNLLKGAGKGISMETIYHQIVGEVEDYAIILLDEYGIVRNWNRGAEKIKGFKAEEVIGKSFRLFYTPEDVLSKHPDHLLEKAIREGRATDEGIRVRKDGTYFWASVVITALHDSEHRVTGFLKVTRDLSDRKAHEEELKAYARRLQEANQILSQQAEFLDTILDSSVDLIAVFDTERRFKTFNKKCEDTYGLKREQVIGRVFRDVFPPSIASESDQELDRALAGEFLYTPNYKSFTGKIFERFLIPLKEGARVYGVLLIAHDITEVVRASIQLKAANDILAAKNTELERSNQELASFSYVASHDLQEPLRKIQTFASRILLKGADDFSEDIKDYFSRMQNAAGRMQTLIEDLLAYSRINTSERQFVECDLSEILSEVIAEFSDNIEEMGGRIDCEQLPVLRIVPFQIKQLFNNIISNAIKFARPDVALLISVTYSKVRAAGIDSNAYKSAGTYHCISVADNGIGFEQKYAQRIFQIFQRLHGKSEYSGTGIGLAICQRIMQNHEGFINAESVPGEGSVFRIYIPAP